MLRASTVWLPAVVTSKRGYQQYALTWKVQPSETLLATYLAIIQALNQGQESPEDKDALSSGELFARAKAELLDARAAYQ
jgi:hypothetical protein